MEVFLIGEYIRQNRLAQGLTQAELCEGICEPASLSRLENGTQTPHRNRVVALLQRLGLPDDRFYALLTPEEMRLGALQKEITGTVVWFVHMEGEEKRQTREEGLAKLREMEQVAESDDRITRQYILSARTAFGTPEGDYSTDEQISMLMEAIRMTVPRFDLEEIGASRYSMAEAQIVNQIAIAYSSSGDHKRAVDIYRQLFKYVETHFCQIIQSTGQLPLVAANYAIELGLCKRYEEAIEVAERGQAYCVKYGHYQMLPELIHVIAECRYHLGDLEESRKLYHQAYWIYQAVADQHNCDILKKEAKEFLGIDFEM